MYIKMITATNSDGMLCKLNPSCIEAIWNPQPLWQGELRTLVRTKSGSVYTLKEGDCIRDEIYLLVEGIGYAVPDRP